LEVREGTHVDIYAGKEAIPPLSPGFAALGLTHTRYFPAPLRFGRLCRVQTRQAELQCTREQTRRIRISRVELRHPQRQATHRVTKRRGKPKIAARPRTLLPAACARQGYAQASQNRDIPVAARGAPLRFATSVFRSEASSMSQRCAFHLCPASGMAQGGARSFF